MTEFRLVDPSLRNRTGFQAELMMSYGRLVRLFGEPNFGPSLDNKVQCEWVIMTPLGVATIYDYKSDIEPELNIHWHVGGRGKEAAEALVAFVLA